MGCGHAGFPGRHKTCPTFFEYPITNKEHPITNFYNLLPRTIQTYSEGC